MGRTKRINLEISEKGFFLGNERLNLLEYNFHDIRLKNHFYIVDGKSNPDSNCVIAYSFHSDIAAFFLEMNIWFSPDNQPLSKKDYAGLKKYYDIHNPEFNARLNKYKLCANINLDIFERFEPGEKFKVPSGLNNVAYDCVFFQSKETGLYCFKLVVNPIYPPKGFFETEEGQKIIKLYDAINRIDVEGVRELICEGADFRYKKLNNLSTPFDAAIASRCADICEILLQHGADVNQINGYGPDHSSLHLAFDAKSIESGKVLLRYGANYNLFKIIDSYENDFLEFILKCGVNPNTGIYQDIFTPLMWAVMVDNLKAVELLIEYGADINAVSVHNGTALRVAVLLNQVEIAAHLIEHGAKIDFLTDGKTNLEEALSSKHICKTMVRLLAYSGGHVQLNTISMLYNKHKKDLFVLSKPLVPVYFSQDIFDFMYILRLISIMEK